MEEFKFTGNWNPKVTLNELTKLGHEDMFSPNAIMQWIRDIYEDHKSNKVQFRIYPAMNSNQYPEEIQINAINYIINNEQIIYSQIYDNLINIIYPHYSASYEEDIQEYAPLKSIDDMPKVLGLTDISIEVIGSDEIAWSIYKFEWKGDEEHGLSMLFEGSKFIKHDSAGDMWIDELISEEKLENYSDLHHRDMPNKMYYPALNRQFYKPWELEKTRDFLLDLLRDGNYSEFKSNVSSKEFNVNQKFPEDEFSLIEYLIRDEFIDAAKFLFDRGTNTQGLMHNGFNLLENIKRIQFINDVNGNIDEADNNNETLLTKYLTVANDAIELNSKKVNDNMSFLESLTILQRDKKSVFLKKIQTYKEHIKLLIECGAKIDNPTLFDKVSKFMKL
ncbi:MAG: hypothetical protein RLZZ546_1921 [Bacteroidota bacterium]